jgi:hypothetical protein
MFTVNLERYSVDRAGEVDRQFSLFTTTDCLDNELDSIKLVNVIIVFEAWSLSCALGLPALRPLQK